MILRILATMVFIVAAMVMFTMAVPAADATTAWNTYCAACNFDELDPDVAILDTFADHYNGKNAEADFAVLIGLVAEAMATEATDIDLDDLMRGTLTDWPIV